MKDFYEKMELYLSEDLPEAERLAFQTALQADLKLAEEANLYRQVDEMGRAYYQNSAQEEALRQKLEKIGSSFFQEKQASGWRTIIPMPARKALAVAAVVMLMVTAWYLLRPSALSDAYKATYPIASFTQMGSTGDALLAKASKDYQSKQYPEALNLFQQYLQTNPADAEAQLLLGVCLLETGNLPSAADAFESLARNKPDYRTEATWLLALTRVKEKNWEKAQTALRQIPEGSNRSEEAMELLKKVEEIIVKGG